MDRKKSSLAVGPRTGRNILQGKNIRKLEDGGTRFDDYWTDDESSDGLEVTTLTSLKPSSNEPVLLSTSTETVKKSFKVYDSSPSTKVHKKSYVKKTVEKSFFVDSKNEFLKDNELSNENDANIYHSNIMSGSHNYSPQCSPIKNKRTDETFNFNDACYHKESVGLSKSPEKEYMKSEKCQQDSKACNLKTKAAGTSPDKCKINSESKKNLLSNKSEIASTLERTDDSNEISCDENTYYEQSTKSDIPSMTTGPIIIAKKAFNLPSCLREPKKLSNKSAKGDKISVTLSQKDVEAFKLKKQAERESVLDEYDINIIDMAGESQGTTKKIINSKKIVTSEKNTDEDTSSVPRSMLLSKEKSSENCYENIPVKNSDQSSPVKVHKKTSGFCRSPSMKEIQNLTLNTEPAVDSFDSKILNMIEENDDQHMKNTSDVPDNLNKHELNELSSVAGTKTVKSCSEEASEDSKKDEVSPIKGHRNLTSPKKSHKTANPKTKNTHKSILNTEMISNGNVSVVNEVSSFKSLSPSKSARNLFNCSVRDENVVKTYDNILTKDVNEHIETTNKRSSTAKLKDLEKTMQNSPKKAKVIEEIPSFSKVSPSRTTENQKTSFEQCTNTINEDINSDNFAEDTEADEDDSVKTLSHDEHNKSGEIFDSGHNNLQCHSQRVSLHEENLNSTKYAVAEGANHVAVTSTPVKNIKRISNNSGINFEAGHLTLNSSQHPDLNEETRDLGSSTPTKSSKKQNKNNDRGYEYRSENVDEKKISVKAKTSKEKKLKNMDIQSKTDLNSSEHSHLNNEKVDETEKSEKTVHTKKKKSLKLISHKTKNTSNKKNRKSSQHLDKQINDTDSNTPSEDSKKQNESNEDCHLENVVGKKTSEKAKKEKRTDKHEVDYYSVNSPEVLDEAVEVDMTLQIKSPNKHTLANGLESDAAQKEKKSEKDLERIKAQNAVPESIRSPSSKRTKKQKSLKRKKASIQTFNNLNSSEQSVADNNNVNEAAENSVSGIVGKQSSTGTTGESPKKVQRTADESPESVQEGQHNLSQPEVIKEVSTDAPNMPPPPKKRKNQKSSRLNKSSDLNCRRSNRQRHAPVAYWRNERILYDFQEGVPVSHGIQEATHDDYLNWKKKETETIKNKNAKKYTDKCKIKSKRKVSVGVVQYYSSMPWDIPQGTSPDEGYVIKRMFENEKCGFGYIKIKPGKIKPLQYMPHDDLQFSVFQGSVEVKFGEKSFNLDHKDFVIVPRKNAYSIKNIGTSTAVLQFSVGDYSDVIK